MWHLCLHTPLQIQPRNYIIKKPINKLTIRAITVIIIVTIKVIVIVIIITIIIIIANI